MGKKKEKIEQEIARLQGQLEELNTIDQKVRQLSDYSDKEKIAIFDDFYEQALDHLKAVKEDEARDDDSYYMFEAIMELLSPRDGSIWPHYEESMSLAYGESPYLSSIPIRKKIKSIMDQATRFSALMPEYIGDETK